MFNKDKNWLF